MGEYEILEILRKKMEKAHMEEDEILSTFSERRWRMYSWKKMRVFKYSEWFTKRRCSWKMVTV